MKNKFFVRIIILVSVSLVCTLSGCHGSSPQYDPRLMVVDSLLRENNPDSALQVLSAINSAALRNASDQAYYALLLTQAQYRCYVDIKSDSTINVALDYYKRHDGEQEKLTRCYIYKGAVTEVLDDPETAMTYYKQAVNVASPDDHFNQGYANLRIGSLYRDYLVKDSADIAFLKQGLYHFSQVPDSFYIATCLSTIGSSYSAINRKDSALVYLEQADKLIKAQNMESMKISNLRYLADLKMFSNDPKDIVEAKNIAVSLANKDTDERNHLLLAAAFTLAKLNKADSANYYLRQVVKDKLTDGLRVLYNDCNAELARCRGDVDQFKCYFMKANQISDSLSDNTMQMQLRDVEAKYDNETLKYKALKYKTNWQISLLGALLAISILVIALMAFARKSAQRKREIASNEETIERLQSDAIQLASQLEANHEMSEGLKATIRHQIDTFTQLVELHYTQFTHFPEKFNEMFKKSYSLNQPDLSFWTGLRAYVDSTCNDIITRTLEEYPLLSEGDVRFLSLCCCNLPNSAIMACLGYNSDLHSIYRKKRLLAKKMKLNGKLDDYIQAFKAGEE